MFSFKNLLRHAAEKYPESRLENSPGTRIHEPARVELDDDASTTPEKMTVDTTFSFKNLIRRTAEKYPESRLENSPGTRIHKPARVELDDDASTAPEKMTVDATPGTRLGEPAQLEHDDGASTAPEKMTVDATPGTRLGEPAQLEHDDGASTAPEKTPFDATQQVIAHFTFENGESIALGCLQPPDGDYEEIRLGLERAPDGASHLCLHILARHNEVTVEAPPPKPKPKRQKVAVRYKVNKRTPPAPKPRVTSAVTTQHAWSLRLGVRRAGLAAATPPLRRDHLRPRPPRLYSPTPRRETEDVYDAIARDWTARHGDPLDATLAAWRRADALGLLRFAARACDLADGGGVRGVPVPALASWRPRSMHSVLQYFLDRAEERIAIAVLFRHAAAGPDGGDGTRDDGAGPASAVRTGDREARELVDCWDAEVRRGGSGA